jgi:hypothetical protein
VLTSDTMTNAQERDQFAKFFVNALNFLDYQELPYVVPDFEKEFLTFINPLFNQLCRFYEKLESQSTIESVWKQIAVLYVRRRDYSGGSAAQGLTGTNLIISIENDAKKIIYQALKENKTIEFDEDELQIF